MMSTFIVLFLLQQFIASNINKQQRKVVSEIYDIHNFHTS